MTVGIILQVLVWFVVILYGLLMFFIFCYSLVQLHLTFKYILARRREYNVEESYLRILYYPMVTIQLPVFNERYVIYRLIKSVVAFDYPKDRMEVQILDDSTDDTTQIIQLEIHALKHNGVRINHIRRKGRKGFKAGALENGLRTAKGEFIAVFDADFVPSPDFLAKTIPYFEDKKIGVVQTRWEHLNKESSFLTRMQAFGLDAHFSIEQVGRNYGGYFINFNGTAGIWRKDCIADAGGWKDDTLTEDLDLSYRAQLKGWKFKYLESVKSPAELPISIEALKSQQYRWTKGAAECMRKNLKNVLTSRSLSVGTKIHAIFHLMNSSVFVCIILIAILSIPMLFVKEYFPIFEKIFLFASLFLSSFLILGFFYWTSEKNASIQNKITLSQFLIKFPAFLSITMALSLHNGIGVFEGYLGRKTPFIRTPKFNSGVEWKKNVYLSSALSPMLLAEILLGIYFLTGVFIAFYIGDFGLLPFHIMLAGGFLTISYYSVIQSTKFIKIRLYELFRNNKRVLQRGSFKT